jgi:hypothetical protein
VANQGWEPAKWRRHAILALLLPGFALASIAQEESIEPLPSLPAWTHTVDLRARTGYKDNVALANDHPDGSPFVGVGLELGLWRWLGTSTELEFFGLLDERRFLSAESVEKERTAYGLAQIKTTPTERWQIGLGFEYIHQDQILDVSVNDPDFDTVRVLAHGFVAKPSARWTAGGSSFEIQAWAQRQFYREPLDDYWEPGGRIAWGIPYGQGSELEFSYEFRHLLFDKTEERTAEGDRVPGTHRAYNQQETRASWRHTWDENRRWRTTTRLSARWNEDNGSGFFNYTRGQVSEQVRFRTRNWELEGEARLAHYDYALQTADDGVSHRDRTDVAFRASIERRLLGSLKIFAEYNYERTLANRASEKYTVNTCSGGLNWGF